MKRILAFTLLFSNAVFSQVLTYPGVSGTAASATRPQHNPPAIINDYTEVNSYNICDNSFIVANAGAFKAGDTVLLIQMKGALTDTSNTANFGTILDYRNAGNYEFNYISEKSGNQ